MAMTPGPPKTAAALTDMPARSRPPAKEIVDALVAALSFASMRHGHTTASVAKATVTARAARATISMGSFTCSGRSGLGAGRAGRSLGRLGLELDGRLDVPVFALLHCDALR